MKLAQIPSAAYGIGNAGPAMGMTPPDNGAAVLITGGAGFIGCHLAARLLRTGCRVLILDDLSSIGAARNLDWLRQVGGPLEICIGDVRDPAVVKAAVAKSTLVYHLAARDADSARLDPPQAFAVNAFGTLTLLEAMRAAPTPPGLVFMSTTDVYGRLQNVDLEPFGLRCRPHDARLRTAGVSESRPLDFAGSYACAKGAADQYVLEYARSFALPATVLRAGDVYGSRQYGVARHWISRDLEDALDGVPITIHGDGRQISDPLYVDDLVQALLLCPSHMSQLRGHAFNLGGGPASSISPGELAERLSRVLGRTPAVARAPAYANERRWFVADTHAFTSATGWRARTTIAGGLACLLEWLRAERTEAVPVTAEAAVA